MTRESMFKVARTGIRTACEAALAVIGIGQIGITDVQWWVVLDIAGLAFIVSVLNSIVVLLKPTKSDKDV